MRKVTKVCGVYKIQSISHPDWCYVGGSSNIKSRRNHHMNSLLRNKHHSIKLQLHYNEYGKDDLVFVVLLECEKSTLIENEQIFMDETLAYFNTSKVAWSAMIGRHHTEESKNKLRYTSSHISDEVRKKMSESQIRIGNKPPNQAGIKKSEEHKHKISESHKGLKFSEESKKRMSEAQKGNTYNLGSKHTPERIETNRQSHLGEKCWNFGKHDSEETKAKRTASLKEYYRKKKEFDYLNFKS